MPAEFPENIKQYLTTLEQWMTHYGFSPLGVEPNWLFDKGFKRERTEATKFGKASTYCFIKYASESYDAKKYRIFSNESFNYALNIRTGNPLGLGAMLIVYPLLIVDKISNELLTETKIYLNKHFAANEFPVILDMSSGDIHFYPSTPMWGALYYNGFRKEVFELYSPKSWRNRAGGSKKLFIVPKWILTQRVPGNGKNVIKIKKSCSLEQLFTNN